MLVFKVIDLEGFPDPAHSVFSFQSSTVRSELITFEQFAGEKFTMYETLHK